MSWLSTIGRLLLLGPFYKIVGSAKSKRQPTDAREQSASVAEGSAPGSFLGSMARSLFLSAIVIGASFALMLVNPTLGVITMMLYSSYMVINSSRKEMPLNRFTALLPGVMAVVTFLVMLGLIRSFDAEIAVLGMVPGAVIGYLMARGHKVYEKNGIVYAKRTFFYIVIWAISMLITQGSTLFGVREITEFSSMLNGFSTAMMVVLSVFLFMKATGGAGPLRSFGKVAAIFVLVIMLLPLVELLVPRAEAYTVSGKDNVEISNIAGKYVFQEEQRFLPKYLKTGLDFSNKTYGYRLGLVSPKKYRGDALFMLHYKKSSRDIKYRFKLFKDVKKTSKTKFKDARNYSLTAGGKGYFYYDKWYKTKETGGYKKQGAFLLPETVRGSLNYINCEAIWVYRDWFLEIRIRDYPSDQYTNFGHDHESKCKNTITRIVQRVKNLQLSGSASPSPSPNPSPSPSSSLSPSPTPSPRSDFEFSDDEQAAGILLALMLLATGVGMNAAISAVMSGATSAAQQAAMAGAMAGGSSDGADDDNYGYDSRTHSNGTLILDGDEAKNWMKNNGYLDKNGKPNKNGNPTEKFEDFMTAMDSDPVEKGLQGVVIIKDDNGKPTGEYVIIVDDDAPASQADDSSDTDDQSQDTDKDNKDQSTDNSSTDSDDEDTSKATDSDADASKNNKNGTTDDKNQNSDPPAQKDNKAAPDPKDTQAKPPVEQTPPIEYPNAKEDLEKMMGEISKEKTKEGYYVKNRHDFERTFDYLHERHPEDYNEITKELTSDLGWTYDKITKALNNFPLLSGAVDYFGGWTGGQCGEYAKHGMDWSKKHLNDKYGDGTLIDDIVYMSKESDNINHGATKIILPNGDKYILDYWESMQTKKPAVYTEEEWIKKCANSRDLGKGGDVSMTTGERELKNAIGVPKLGEEKGKQWFLDHAKDKKIANSIIKAWEKKPW